METVKKLLEEKNLVYKHSGNDFVIHCLSPEHPDHNPSMRIDKLTGIFNCYSCSFSGNIFSYYGLHNNLLNVKVVKLREKIQNIMRLGLTIPLGAEPFSQEYRSIKPTTFKHFNAFTHIDFDGRVVFPITDISGNIVVFQARYIYSEIEPVYIFEPRNAEVPLFPAKPNIINGSIILVEGIFDMLNLYDKGLTNAVCTFGVSFGSVKNHAKQEKNIEKLQQYKLQGVNTIYILYDGDKPGYDAAENLKKYLNKHFIVETIELDDGVDPGKLTQAEVTNLKELLYGS